MMHRTLAADTHIHADETTTQVLKEDGRKPTAKSYMWLFQTGKHSNTPIILYHYAPTRSAKIPKAFLKAFTGYLHCDGYEGYNQVTDIIRVGCWAHARRKFEEARVVTPASSEKKTHSEIGLDYCNQLFKWERDWSALSPADRHVKRLTYAAPLLEQFWSWVDAVHVLPASKLGKALSYVKNQKDFLMNYLQDGVCEISNNTAERSIWPFVVGRKNWYFSSSVKGAKASAKAYSFIETAKANGLNVQKYLTYLFESLPNIDFDENPNRLSAYLPWSKHIQEKCR